MPKPAERVWSVVSELLSAGRFPVFTAPALFDFRTPAGLTLRGEMWGAGSRDFVFTHGNGFTAQTYAPALAPIAPRVRVHGVNLRGHGGSGCPAEFPDWNGPYDDLVAYLRERCAAPAILAGHSYGATLSLRVAAEHPELVGGLVLLEPLVLAGRHDDWGMRDGERSRAMIARAAERRSHWASREEAAAWLRARGAYQGWAEPAFAAFVATALVPAEDGGVQLACPPWLEARGYMTLPDAIVFRWADAIRVPTAFLRGARSFPGAALEDLARAIAISVVMTVPGTHTFPMEHPAGTGRAVAAGLDLVLRAEGGDGVEL